MRFVSQEESVNEPTASTSADAAGSAAQQSAISDSISQASGTPVVVKDFQIVINIADVVKSVMVDTKTDLFYEWTFTYCHTIIKLSTR